MSSIPKVRVVVSCAIFALVVTLSGCQSTTGKTAGQTMSDASISSAVQTKLTSDRLSNFPRIDVDTERGVVNLSGVVETEAQRTQAGRLAHQVEGVVKVNNNLQIQNRPPSGKPAGATSADDMKAGHPERQPGHVEQKDMMTQTQGAYIIQGNVVRVEGDNYLVQGQDGREISLHADNTTMKTQTIKPGDRVEVKVDQNNHALSMLPAP